MNAIEQEKPTTARPGYLSNGQRVFCVECTPLIIPSFWRVYQGSYGTRCSGCGCCVEKQTR